ncbi:helix-turn-helix domain-containing protein [Bordetella petrii]|nr:helix-turn-helix domain-containing protein [Bordetella petrii]
MARADKSESAADADRDVTGPRSLTRVLGIFGVLSEVGDGVSLTDLSLALKSPKSSLLNLLRPLVADEYLVNDGGVYRLGPSIYRLSSRVLASWNFPRLIRPFMEELAERTGESVLLSVLNREAEVATYVEIIPSPHPVRYHIAVGTTRPLYASSAGRLLLAYTDKAWRDSYLSSVAFKAKTAVPMNRVWLRRELEQIRKEGVAAAIDVYMVGLAAVAAPVFDAEGQCVAALTLAGPTERFRHELTKLKNVLREVAARSSGVVMAGGEGDGFRL